NLLIEQIPALLRSRGVHGGRVDFAENGLRGRRPPRTGGGRPSLLSSRAACCRRSARGYTRGRALAATSVHALAEVVVHAVVGEVEPALHLVLVLRQDVGADDLGRLEIAAAVEAGRDVRAAGAVVDRGLRVRAERAGDGAAGGLRQDLRRRGPVFHPVHEGAEEVLRLGPIAPAA